VSFASPGWLLALLLVPLLAAAYLLAQRRRRRYAVRFANFPALAAAVPPTPGWRRHLPPVLLAAALAALALALAKPERTVSVARDNASILLILDTSGSMSATDVQPDRLDAARSAANKFLDQVPKPVQVGLVSFAATATILQAPTTDRQAVRDGLTTLEANGGTATADAIETGLRALDPGKGKRRPPSAIVLLSDGKATSGSDPVAAAGVARRLHVPITTIAFGTPDGVIEQRTPFGDLQRLAVPPDPEALKAIAKTSGGRFFEVQDAGRLNSVYQSLGSQLGSRKVQREITAAFAGGALVLLLAGGGLSMLWFGRAGLT
jgi:Ca-activated chloride channel family protein